jgi:urease accessory protein
MNNISNSLGLLRLMQLADSALPIGALSHSLGLETLAAEEILTVSRLETFLQGYLEEAGQFEGTFCRLAYRLAGQAETFGESWLVLNQRLSAFKLAREARLASATLGRRFVQLSLSLEDAPQLRIALDICKSSETDLHHSPAFGLVGGMLGIEEEAVVLAYLHQSVTSLVSACQRLLPLGQSQASQILWRLKPKLNEAVEQSRENAENPEKLQNFTPILELGSLRHSLLTTKLFIS